MSRLLLALSFIAVSFGIGRAMVAEGSIDRIYTLPFYAVTVFECHFDECYAGHRGNDYQLGDASAGGEVVAAAYAGSVHREFQPGPGGAGYFMTIDHRNTHMTRYLHLQSYVAAEGSNVARGEIVGYEGNSGGPWCQNPPQCTIWASPYHLHFETKINATPGNYSSGTAVNPYAPSTYLWEDQAPGDSAHQPNHADFSPAIASWVSTRVDMFVRGENNELYQRTRSGGSWGSWFRPFAPGGTCLRSAPAATTWSTSRWDVFVRGCDNAIWRVWWDGSWHSQSLGGCTLGAPGASSWGTNRIDVLVRGCDNVLYWTATNNGGAGWSTWSTIGPGTCLRSGPSAVSWGYNRIDLVYRSCSDAIVHHWYTGTWQPAESFYGCTMVAPAIASRGGNYLDVFHRACGPANNEGIIQKSWNGSSWTAWTDISPGTDCLASGPGADAWAPEMLDVPYRGCGSPDNAFIAYSNGGGWTHSFFGPWP